MAGKKAKPTPPAQPPAPPKAKAEKAEAKAAGFESFGGSVTRRRRIQRLRARGR